MKKILLLSIGLAMVCGVLSAQNNVGIRFADGSLKTILAKAKAADKYVFMDVYTTWCGPCKYMAANVFTDKNVGNYFNATFINAKFDAEKGEGIAIAQRYGVTAYPTFLLLDGDGNLVGKKIGGSPPAEFISKVKALKQKADAQK